MRAISARIILGAALLGGITGPGLAWAGLEEGVKAYQAGDYATAIKEWLPEAEKGDRNALFNLGQVYRMGKGVPKNFDLAEHYYLEAAKLGHPAAQGNLGTLYYFGKANGKPEMDKALKWWRLAARNGDPRSQYMMGVLYFNGKFVDRDLVTAYSWMTLAAQSKLQEAVDAQSKIVGFLNADERVAARRLAPTLVRPTAEEQVAAASIATPAPQPVAAPVALPVAAPQPPASSPVAASRPKPIPAPAPAPAPAPRRVTAGAGNAAYRVQLGAYKSRQVTEESWAALQQAHQALLGDLQLVVTQADLGSRGIFYRMQTGAFATSREASALCGKLTAAKVACMVVKAAR